MWVQIHIAETQQIREASVLQYDDKYEMEQCHEHRTEKGKAQTIPRNGEHPKPCFRDARDKPGDCPEPCQDGGVHSCGKHPNSQCPEKPVVKQAGKGKGKGNNKH